MNFKVLGRACCGVLSVFLLIFGLPFSSVSRADDQAAPMRAEPVEYVVEDIQGAVQVLEDGAKDWEAAEEGQVVEAGDEIKVGENSEATLTLQSETSVHLNAGTDMKIEQIEANQTNGFLSHLQVFAGSLLADVKKHLEESHSTFEIESNGVVCGVRGTAFEVNAVGDTAEVSTHEGSVAVGNGTETHMVDAGNFSSFQRGRFLMQRRLDGSEIGRFQKWRAFRQHVWKKRLQRLADIRAHRRAPWKRHHAHLRRALLRRKLLEKRRRNQD
jgi:ferric-dicitrate binding protein FerR (iron transport regulator)